MTAQDLKNSILQQAIQGKLVPQNPADEPASELLKKIATERQKLIDEGKIKNATPLPPIEDDEKPFDIPDNWCWVRLGDACQINPRNKLENKNIDATFLPMTSINDGYSNGYNPLVKSWNEIRSGFTHFADGDVIFAKITPCFQNRKSAVVEGLTNGIGAGTTELYVLRSYGKYINEKYLLYFVKNHQFILDGVATMKGTAGQQRISRNFVINYLLPLPPLAEQKRIVAKLEELMPLIERYDAAEKKLSVLDKEFPDKLRKSILQQAIQGKLTEQLSSDGDSCDLLEKIRAEKTKLIADGKIKKEKPLPPIKDDEKPFDIPDNWQWVRLGEIGETNIGLTYSPENISNDGIIVLRSGNIQNGKMDYADIVKVNLEIPESKFCCRGDILICARNGSKKLVGKAALIDRDNVTFGAFMAKFRSKCNEYILLVINSPYFRKMLSGDVGTMTINQITQGMLKSAVIPLPPLAEQKRIVEKLNELLPLCDALSEKINHF